MARAVIDFSWAGVWREESTDAWTHLTNRARLLLGPQSQEAVRVVLIEGAESLCRLDDYKLSPTPANFRGMAGMLLVLLVDVYAPPAGGRKHFRAGLVYYRPEAQAVETPPVAQLLDGLEWPSITGLPRHW